MGDASQRQSSGDRYDVALSFAAEQRAYVEQVAAGCRHHGIRVFYDDYERGHLWGKDLYQHLDHIYSTAARYCVMFVSADYVRKAWTGHEQRSAQERAFREQVEYILPVIFDDTRAPGLPATIGYLDARHTTPDEVVRLIAEKLGHRPTPAAGSPAPVAPRDPAQPTISNSISGHVTGEVIQAGDITTGGGIHLGARNRPPSA